ncbi:hypothetical protein ACJX0J_025049 [Zea mays]
MQSGKLDKENPILRGAALVGQATSVLKMHLQENRKSAKLLEIQAQLHLHVTTHKHLHYGPAVIAFLIFTTSSLLLQGLSGRLVATKKRSGASSSDFTVGIYTISIVQDMHKQILQSTLRIPLDHHNIFLIVLNIYARAQGNIRMKRPHIQQVESQVDPLIHNIQYCESAAHISTGNVLPGIVKMLQVAEICA